MFRPSCRHEFPLRATYSRRVLRHVAGFPDLRLLCPIRHLEGIQRSPAYLRAPCASTPPAPTPCQGSSPVRVPTLSVSCAHLVQEPSGLPEFSDASLPACHGLMTPADLHALALGARFVLASSSLRLSPSAGYVSRRCTSTSGSAISPTAYRILCLRLVHLVRPLRDSAMDPRLDTGGWPALTTTHYCIATRPGLSPGKRRRASLGATTTTIGNGLGISVLVHQPPPDRYLQLAGALNMQDNALPAIEFVLFIAFAVWLFLWQRGSSRGRDDDDES